jgi:hypothetical protein
MEGILNSWFYYIPPLLISVIFVIAGWSFFLRSVRGDLDSKGNKLGPGTRNLGILLMIVGGALGLAFLIQAPTPGERQRIMDHIFHTPPEQIQRLVIKGSSGNQFRPLASSDVVINDPDRIRQIAQILSSGSEISSDRRHNTRWRARVELVTTDGIYSFGVNAHTSNSPLGAIAKVGTNPDGSGWALGIVRVDGLDKILEDAVNAAGGAFGWDKLKEQIKEGTAGISLVADQ